MFTKLLKRFSFSVRNGFQFFLKPFFDCGSLYGFLCKLGLDLSAIINVATKGFVLKGVYGEACVWGDAKVCFKMILIGGQWDSTPMCLHLSDDVTMNMSA